MNNARYFKLADLARINSARHSRKVVFVIGVIETKAIYWNASTELQCREPSPWQVFQLQLYLAKHDGTYKRKHFPAAWCLWVCLEVWNDQC